MNNRIFFSLALISTLLGCNAQQSQTREVSNFNRIQVYGSVNVIFTTSDTISLRVKAKSTEIDRVETKVEKSKLVIGNKGNFTAPVTVYVSGKDLQAIAASGASSFKSNNDISSQSLDIETSGSSDLQLHFTGKSIRSEQSGASSITLKGTADTMLAGVAGASSLRSYGLSCAHATVTASGAATAKVYAGKSIKANATGASDIRIKGEPSELAAEASTAASISRIRDNSSENTGGHDTTNFNWKKKKIMVISSANDDNDDEDEDDKASFKHWRGFSMGVNGYLNNNMGMTMPKETRFMDLNYARSFNFQFNIIERHFNIVDDYFKIVSGFGFDYHLYEFANRTTLNPDTGYTWGSMDASGSERFLKNKLRCTYLQVPLLLEFNTSKDSDKTFHVAAGVIGQYLISSRTKQTTEKDGVESTRVKKDSYNLSPFAAKAHVNIGYRGWTIFGEYSLTSLFQPSKGPEVYPFTAGIRLVPFG